MAGELKQVIVMRNDLNMRKGKMIAQGAHASVSAIMHHMKDPRVQTWLYAGMTKICVRVDSEEELLAVYEKACKAQLLRDIITDSGRTEFNGVSTRTCCAIGPAYNEDIDPITGHLKLL
jgi:peptidyl-tRNA hydrolase, PTH2 family